MATKIRTLSAEDRAELMECVTFHHRANRMWARISDNSISKSNPISDALRDKHMRYRNAINAAL